LSLSKAIGLPKDYARSAADNNNCAGHFFLIEAFLHQPVNHGQSIGQHPGGFRRNDGD
jgi:hypothetical protein